MRGKSRRPSVDQPGGAERHVMRTERPVRAALALTRRVQNDGPFHRLVVAEHVARRGLSARARCEKKKAPAGGFSRGRPRANSSAASRDSSPQRQRRLRYAERAAPCLRRQAVAPLPHPCAVASALAAAADAAAAERFSRTAEVPGDLAAEGSFPFGALSMRVKHRRTLGADCCVCGRDASSETAQAAALSGTHRMARAGGGSGETSAVERIKPARAHARTLGWWELRARRCGHKRSVHPKCARPTRRPTPAEDERVCRRRIASF